MCNLRTCRRTHVCLAPHISLFLTGNNFMELHKREWRSLSQTLAIPGIFISYSLLPLLDRSYMFQNERSYFHFFYFLFLYMFLAGQSVLAIPLLMFPFLYFEEMSGFEPKELSQQEALYQLSHPPNLAIHFCLSFSGTWKDQNFSFPVDRYFCIGTSVDRTFFFETQTDPRIFLF